MPGPFSTRAAEQVDTVIDSGRALLGYATRVVPFYHIKQCGGVFRKTPVRLFNALRIFAQRQLASRVAPVVLLSVDEWQYREMKLYKDLYGLEVARSNRSLLLPILNGMPLSQLLTSEEYSKKVKIAGVELAILALQSFHKTCAESHGDATAENVIVNLAEGRARWIDFDMSHKSQTDKIAKADDYRSLLISSAHWLSHDAQQSLILQSLLNSIPEPWICTLLQEWHSSGALSRDILHIAQGPFGELGFTECLRSHPRSASSSPITTPRTKSSNT